MYDLISRQAAIDALHMHLMYRMGTDSNKKRLDDWINNLPSAQPERLTDDDFETIRIHLNAYKEKLCNQQRWEEAEEYQRIIDRFMAFASAQPDLSEYSDKLWRNAYERGKRDAQPEQRWIPCSERLPQPNEEAADGFIKAYLVQDGRWMDVARWNGDCWIAWGYGTALINVTAWMPLPEPYREEGDANV